MKCIHDCAHWFAQRRERGRVGKVINFSQWYADIRVGYLFFQWQRLSKNSANFLTSFSIQYIGFSFS